MIKGVRGRSTMLGLAAAVLALAALAAGGSGRGTEWVWPGIRGMLFLLVGWSIWRRRNEGAPLLATLLALAMLGIGGWRGLDAALAVLVASQLRLGREALVRLCLGVAVLGGVALVAVPEGGPLPFPNRNHFAVFTEIVLPFLAWRVQREESKTAMLAAALLLAVSFAGGSRMGLLVLSGEILWLAARWGGRRRMLECMLLLVGLLSLFVLNSPEARWKEPWAGDHRREIWSAAWQMWSEKPWSGWGLGAFPEQYRAYAQFDNGQYVNAAHNDWLEWAVEGGIAGFLLPLGILYAYLRRYAQSLAVWGILFGALHAGVDYPWHLPGFLVLTALLGATFAHYAPKNSLAHSTPAESANVT